MLKCAHVMLPYLNHVDIARFIVTCKGVAASISESYEAIVGWSHTATVAERVALIFANRYCRYCHYEGVVRCPDHWCESCDAYRPVYNGREKRPYICQKCTWCESCGSGTLSLRYVYSCEYERRTIMFAMAICDRCVRECAVCGSPNRYLCVDEDRNIRQSRCMYCRPAGEGIVTHDKFAVE